LKHHARIQNPLDRFGQAYADLKNPRKLVWFQSLGSVQLELDVVEDVGSGRTVVETKEFTCSPLLASLISHFEDKPQWTSEDLSNETGVPQQMIQKRMTYWIKNRVIRIVGTAASATSGTCPVYEMATHQHLTQQTDQDHSSSEAAAIWMDDDEAAVSSSSAYDQEEMDVYMSYIVGMLTNLGQLPLKTIHNNLKTFVTGSDIKYSKTPQQLSVFLQYLCRIERLECGPDGMYKLVKK
jgi:anaphase-promoting complex subunit 2